MEFDCIADAAEFLPRASIVVAAVAGLPLRVPPGWRQLGVEERVYELTCQEYPWTPGQIRDHKLLPGIYLGACRIGDMGLLHHIDSADMTRHLRTNTLAKGAETAALNAHHEVVQHILGWSEYFRHLQLSITKDAIIYGYARARNLDKIEELDASNVWTGRSKEAQLEVCIAACETGRLSCLANLSDPYWLITMAAIEANTRAIDCLIRCGAIDASEVLMAIAVDSSVMMCKNILDTLTHIIRTYRPTSCQTVLDMAVHGDYRRRIKMILILLEEVPHLFNEDIMSTILLWRDQSFVQKVCRAAPVPIDRQMQLLLESPRCTSHRVKLFLEMGAQDLEAVAAAVIEHPNISLGSTLDVLKTLIRLGLDSSRVQFDGYVPQNIQALLAGADAYDRVSSADELIEQIDGHTGRGMRLGRLFLVGYRLRREYRTGRF